MLLILNLVFIQVSVSDEIEPTHHIGQLNIPLGNRFFIVNFLEDIFGKDNISKHGNDEYYLSHKNWEQNLDSYSAALQTTSRYFLSKQSIWGGPCDIYDMSEGGRKALLEFKKYICFVGGGRINSNFSTSSSVVKEGLKIKACEKILQNESAIAHALGKVDLEPNSSEINNVNILKVYSLFFPTRETNNDLTLEAINALRNIPTLEMKTDQKNEAWKNILLTLCYDPSWQIL